MTATSLKQQIEIELHRVIDITLKHGIAPSRAAMMSIMRHEVNRMAEIRGKLGDPNVRIIRGVFVPSEEVAIFADNLIDRLLGPEE